jgi:hypothetical protein
MKRLRRTWRSGLPPFRPVPPVPQQRQPTADEAAERLVAPPANGWTTGQLDAIYPEAGKDWDARSLRSEGKRF